MMPPATPMASQSHRGAVRDGFEPDRMSAVIVSCIDESTATAVTPTAVALSLMRSAVITTRRRGESVCSMMMRGRSIDRVRMISTESRYSMLTVSVRPADTAEADERCDLQAVAAIRAVTISVSVIVLIGRRIRSWRQNTGMPCWRNRGASGCAPRDRCL